MIGGHDHGEIGVADVLRAMRASPDDDKTRRSIARMLGFEAPVVELPLDPQAPAPESAHTDRTKHETPTVETGSHFAGFAESDLPELARVGTLAVTPAHPDRPDPIPVDPSTRIDRVDPTLRPLIPPTVARGALLDLASHPQPVGPIDTSRLVSWIAHRRRVLSLPRLLRPRLRERVWFIADISTVMEPFRRDTEYLLKILTGLLGADQVIDVVVLGDPNDAFTDETGRVTAPPAGFVLAFTDLGAAAWDGAERAAAAAGWANFARRLTAVGSELVALTPYPRERWPVQCRRVMGIVQLDRNTLLRPHSGRR